MKSAAKLTRAAAIAALYVVVTVLTPSFSYGAIQFRIAECLCILAFFYDEAAFGLAIGCLISNFFSPSGVIDVALGTAATLFAGLASNFCYKRIKNKSVAFVVCSLFPILLNSLIVSIAILAVSPESGSYLIVALEVFVGEAVVVLSLGLALYTVFQKRIIRIENE